MGIVSLASILGHSSEKGSLGWRGRAPSQTELGRSGALGCANLRFVLCSSLFLATGFGSGCSSGGLNDNTSSAEQVVIISPVQVVLSANQTMQFTQTGLSGGAVWSVNGVAGGSSATGARGVSEGLGNDLSQTEGPQ